VAQAEARGRLRREPAYHLLPRREAELAHVDGEVACERAPPARMRLVADENAVASAGHRRMREHRAHVLLDADVEQRRDAELLGHEQLAHEIDGTEPRAFGARSHGL